MRATIDFQPFRICALSLSLSMDRSIYTLSYIFDIDDKNACDIEQEIRFGDLILESRERYLYREVDPFV